MFAMIYLLGAFIADLFKSRRQLELENLFLRHQVNIILRRPQRSLRLRGSDRAVMVCVPNVWPAPRLQVDSCELVSNKSALMYPAPEHLLWPTCTKLNIGSCTLRC